MFEKLLQLRGHLANDGSREVIDSLISEAKDQNAVKELRNQEGFKILMKSFRGAFHSRMQDVILQDPELKSLYRILKTMIGRDVDKEIEAIVDEFLEEASSVSEK